MNLRTLPLAALLATGCLVAPSVPAQIVLFDNSTTSLNKVHAPGVEFGDQIVLGTGAMPQATLSSLLFEPYLSSGTADLTVSFYNNDGLLGAPGTRVFNHTFSLSAGAGAIQMSGLNATVNKTFTWTVSFANLSVGGATAGLKMYSPPSIGQDFSDYWEKEGGTTWALKSIPGHNADFGATFSGAAVPEPATVAWMSAYGALALGLILHRQRQRRRATEVDPATPK